MKALMLVGTVTLCFTSFGYAEDVPRSEAASPEVYKVIAEDDKFRVIEATWKVGQKDTWHSHPVAYQYHVNDCSMRIHTRDGKSTDVNPKQGTSRIALPVDVHYAENIGTSDCKIVFFETKS